MINWPDGVGRIFFDSVDSTNKEAQRCVDHTAVPFWLYAAEQTAGVGRRARDWQSPRGNLYATYVMPISQDLQQAALHSFVAALAVRDAVYYFNSESEIFLKWPNDVLWQGGKIAGILLESFSTTDRYLAIGIGINLMSCPEPKAVEKNAMPPVYLDKLVKPKDFLIILANRFAYYESCFARQGFADIREKWLSYAARLGQKITARLPYSEITGIFKTIDMDGALLLEVDGVEYRIHAADIFF